MQKNRRQFIVLGEKLRILCDSNRLLIINELMDGEKSVSMISEELQIEQSLVSHHLKTLRNSGWVKSRRKGREIWYRRSFAVKGGFGKMKLDLKCCSFEL